MKRFIAVLIIVLAVALPLFAQSTVEKKGLSYYQKKASQVQITGGLDFDWQIKGSESVRGAGFRLSAEGFLKNGFNIGLDASLMTLTDGSLSKGPEVIRLSNTFGYHFMVGHATMMRVKAGAGVEVKLIDKKADFNFTTEAGCNLYLKMTDTVAMQFGATCYATMPKGEESLVTFSFAPGFGLAFAI